MYCYNAVYKVRLACCCAGKEKNSRAVVGLGGFGLWGTGSGKHQHNPEEEYHHDKVVGSYLCMPRRSTEKYIRGFLEEYV